MHLKILSFLLFFYSLLGAESLERNYFIESRLVMLSDIVKNPKEDFLLYTIDADRDIKRVLGSELIERLKQHGYTTFDTKFTYIQFNKTSSLNLEKLKEKLKEHYQSKYENIKIDSVSIRTKGDLEILPPNFVFGIQEKEHLSSSGHCFITTPQKKKIFFTYDLVAYLEVYYARKDIQKGSELSSLNLYKKSIMLNRFKALPLQKLKTKNFEAKHNLKKDTLITTRDLTGLYLIKRGDSVNVTLQSSGINISFSAKAVTNGREGDFIYVLRNDKKKIKVRVTGKNRAEI